MVLLKENYVKSPTTFIMKLKACGKCIYINKTDFSRRSKLVPHGSLSLYRANISTLIYTLRKKTNQIILTEELPCK